MDIALVAVIAANAVTIVTLWVNRQDSDTQRKHESRLAFEERIWERKSEALLGLIVVAVGFEEAVDESYKSPQSKSGSYALRLAEAMPDTSGVVQAYCSDRMRTAFVALRRLLAAEDLDFWAIVNIDLARRAKEDAIEARNYEKATQERDNERTALAALNASQSFGQTDIQDALSELLSAARDDLRAS